MPTFTLLFIAAYLLGLQVQLSELPLLTRRYAYRVQAPQWVTFVATLAVVGLTCADVMQQRPGALCLAACAAVAVAFLTEWVLALVSPSRLALTLLIRLAITTLFAAALWQNGTAFLLPAALAGIYVRNTPFGVVHGKPLFMAYRIPRRPMNRVVATEAASPSDHSPAPQAEGFYDVTQHGIQPDTGEDLTEKVQALIDEAGSSGGGRIFFPRGRYLFNRSGRRTFLAINHSHITIEGETDADGHLLTELICCGTTVEGRRNPWLSPFFITTAETLQPSNMFWGLDFRKPKGVRTQSSSLSDPGSDGTILTPPFATRVTADAREGDTRLTVADSSAIGRYIMLGLYNTSADGNLVKELLGMDTLREEWLTARRAGEEEAPSFQWLVEVRAVIDRHTIELARPLLRDCPLRYAPAIFNAEMLEDIHIRNLRVGTTWNGLFRHHGFPLYYSVGKSQEMDYGWNGINMKRTAHSTVENVVLSDFTNPIYVLDSRDVDVSHVVIRGYDGHQGLKMYCHTCDCRFSHIDFLCHFADMMGGEGNAYANIFSDIRYLNPTFKPVDYDFHGFTEGPMSPPAYNRFVRIEGFRYIKGAGAIYNLPACGRHNTWSDTVPEGAPHGAPLYYAMNYRIKSGLERLITAVGFSVVAMLKSRRRSPRFFVTTVRQKLLDIDRNSIPQSEHAQFFPA